MKELEEKINSFILKIWIEDRAEEYGQQFWRGHITHVPSGERVHISELEDITAYFKRFLKNMTDN
jgi:hypothetical protein